MLNMVEKKGLNNEGLSLVELLVALAVSAIVLTGVAYMIFNVLQIYTRANANVELQNESQVAMNLVMDNVMDTNGLCLIEAPKIPEAGDTSKDNVCVLLGELNIDENDNYRATFTGEAIIWMSQDEEVYLRSYEGGINLVEGGASTESDSAIQAINEIMEKTTKLDKEDRLPYLLARYVTVFDLRPAEITEYKFPEAEMEMNPDNPTEEKEVYYYVPPMVLSLHMEFRYEYKEGQYLTRSMDDDVTIRNGLRFMYIQRAAKAGKPDVSPMIKYYRKNK